jgi:hypothetical protein
VTTAMPEMSCQITRRRFALRIGTHIALVELWPYVFQTLNQLQPAADFR